MAPWNCSLQLPQRDADLYTWARRIAPLFDRGPRAALLLATSRQRLAGPGELAGISDLGRLRDIRYTRSEIRDKEVYRYREISPERQAIVLIDLRDVAQNLESRRLVSCAVAAAVLLVAIPDTTLTWAAFGADRLVPPIDIESSNPARLLRGAAEAMLRFGRDPLRFSLRKQEGMIRRVLAYAPDAHLVLVTHYLEPELLRRLPFAFGASIFLVEGAADGLRNPRGGMTFSGLLPPGLTGELNPPFHQAAEQLQSRRSHCLPIPAEGDLLEAITATI